jgi:hypothetical protein
VRRVLILAAIITVASLLLPTSAPAVTSSTIRSRAASETTEDGREAAAKRQQATRAAAGFLAAQPFCDAPSEDDHAHLAYLHFGNAAAGIAVIQSSIRQEYSDLCLPITGQAIGRGIRLRNVTRIALQAVLHTRGGTTNSDAAGPIVNSGDVGNPTILKVTSPKVSTGGLVPDPQWCVAWVDLRYAIRWADGTLTSGKVLVSPSLLFNDNCYFTGP